MSLFWQIFLTIVVVNFVLTIIGGILYHTEWDFLGELLVLLLPTQLVVLIILIFLDLIWKWSWF